jgi:cold-inducible RNA-binding protein
MSKKLFVGGLSWGTTESALRDYFSQAGAVASAVVINDKATGRSKGFGFVEYDVDEEAEKAIDMFDGKEFEGRTLNVSEARPMEDRPARRPQKFFNKR